MHELALSGMGEPRSCRRGVFLYLRGNFRIDLRGPESILKPDGPFNPKGLLSFLESPSKAREIPPTFYVSGPRP